MNLDEDYSSDSSDEDFNPELEQGKLSEEELSGTASEVSDDEEEESGKRKRKGRKTKRKRRKRAKAVADEEEIEEEKIEAKEVSTEDEKARVDDLWSSFMKDVGGPVKTSNPSVSTSVGVSVSDKRESNAVKPLEKKKTVTEIFNFAGEEVKVTKEISSEAQVSSSPGNIEGKRPPPKTGGLAAIAGMLGKGKKMTTLEKTKLDWDSFKKEENIEEELKTFNQGKHGYLERQAFLERADYRQFEKERDMRQSKRPQK
ncbi:craniofacial development protein 1-like [Artemia franciscana]|uniref:Craniofacial development protein 1 n=1 Tax=Artemia franciscana TaxID=6661 RepID=A0AA88KRJ2_ARTSF|nr:hypothetical protein QYM36_018429 [Artemia franciscana]